jgi:hypothetical protein
MCLPLGHRIVTRELVMEWANHLMQVASSLDLRRLISALLRRAAALPARLVAELKRFRALLSRGEDPVANFASWGWRFFSVLMLVLVLAQTAMPTSAYAKGFGGAVSHSGGVAHQGGGAYYGGTHPSGWYYPSPGSGHPMPRPGAPVVQRRSGYVSGGAGTTTNPYYYSGGAGDTTGPYYYYSDDYYNYYYRYENGRYYYYYSPRR